MNSTYLLQRGTFVKEPLSHKKGLDSVIKFDYMGSSEFEWGALPKSLERIRSRIEEYSLHDALHLPFVAEKFGNEHLLINSFGKKLLVFCRDDQFNQASTDLTNIVKDGIRLKERAGLRDHFDPRANPPSIAQLKKHGTQLSSRGGYRTFNYNGSLYTLDNQTKDVKAWSLDLDTNFWWSVDCDWMAFFNEPKHIKLFSSVIKGEEVSVTV